MVGHYFPVCENHQAADQSGDVTSPADKPSLILWFNYAPLLKQHPFSARLDIGNEKADLLGSPRINYGVLPDKVAKESAD